MQRVVSLALVMCGLVLGMLLAQRPWVDPVTAATPSTRTSIECIGYDTRVNTNDGDPHVSKAEVYVANIGSGSSSVSVIWRDFDGDTLDSNNFTLDGGAISELNSNSVNGDPVAKVVVTGTKNHLWADGRMNWNINDNNGQTQISCIRNPANVPT